MVTVILVALSLAMAVSASATTFAQQATLTASDEIGKSGLGSSVALSRNGKIALVGGPQDNNGTGAAWVFVRKHDKWTEQAKLTGSGESGEGRSGTSVALSRDGNTALVGGPRDNSVFGAAWVFTRRGSTWTEQGSKLTGGGEEVPKVPFGACEGEEHEFAGFSGLFGASVALSRDGNTALIGGPRDGNVHGAAWVFTRSGSTWTQQGNKLTGNGEEVIEERFGGECWGLFGASVALASHGNTALIGGPGDHYEGGSAARGPRGAAWVFTHSHSTWTQQGEKLTGRGGDAIGGVYFGESASLSADGNIALVGGPLDNWPNRYVGAAWVYTRFGSTWTQQGEKLKNSEPVKEFPDERFGSSAALSSDGKTALIGSGRGGSLGGAWVFTNSGSTWTQQGPKFTSDEGGVALSGDGGVALVGTAVFVSAPPHK